MLSTVIEHDAEIATWFGVGGRADTLARPGSVGDLRDLLLAFADQPVRILGDGANLLVDDRGVDGLVVSLEALRGVERLEDAPGGLAFLRVGAGANLPRLILDTVREGLAGLESLGGIPATLGGAVVMNAGGAFGEIAGAVHSVHALTRAGDAVTIPAAEIAFDYRHSGLNHLVLTGVDLRLRPVPEGEKRALRERLKEVMAYKKHSQPMAERSAGCAFRNPKLRGERVSAGRLIDEAGCKGMTVGSATVSAVHANFITVRPADRGGCAADVIELMERISERVRAHHGVVLEPEIAVWKRGGAP